MGRVAVGRGGCLCGLRLVTAGGCSPGRTPLAEALGDGKHGGTVESSTADGTKADADIGAFNTAASTARAARAFLFAVTARFAVLRVLVRLPTEAAIVAIAATAGDSSREADAIGGRSVGGLGGIKRDVRVDESHEISCSAVRVVVEA